MRGTTSEDVRLTQRRTQTAVLCPEPLRYPSEANEECGHEGRGCQHEDAGPIAAVSGALAITRLNTHWMMNGMRAKGS